MRHGQQSMKDPLRERQPSAPGFLLIRRQHLAVLAPRWQACCDLMAASHAHLPDGVATMAYHKVADELGITHIAAYAHQVPAVWPQGAPARRSTSAPAITANEVHARCGRLELVARVLRGDNAHGWEEGLVGSRVGWGARSKVQMLPDGRTFEVEEERFISFTTSALLALTVAFFGLTFVVAWLLLQCEDEYCYC